MHQTGSRSQAAALMHCPFAFQEWRPRGQSVLKLTKLFARGVRFVCFVPLGSQICQELKRSKALVAKLSKTGGRNEVSCLRGSGISMRISRKGLREGTLKAKAASRLLRATVGNLCTESWGRNRPTISDELRRCSLSLLDGFILFLSSWGISSLVHLKGRWAQKRNGMEKAAPSGWGTRSLILILHNRFRGGLQGSSEGQNPPRYF